jgi:hypothetical protein
MGTDDYINATYINVRVSGKSIEYSSLFDEFLCKLGEKKTQFTQERVEYNFFLLDEPLKGSKSLKTFRLGPHYRLNNRPII